MVGLVWVWIRHLINHEFLLPSYLVIGIPSPACPLPWIVGCGTHATVIVLDVTTSVISPLIFGLLLFKLSHVSVASWALHENGVLWGFFFGPSTMRASLRT